jgi:lysozyme family protein
MTTIRDILNKNIAMNLNMADQELLTEIQIELQIRNYYNGKIDGLYGQQTAKAWSDFKAANYQSRPNLIGAASLQKLLSLPIKKIFPYEKGYTELWNNSKINTDALDIINNIIYRQLIPNQSSYQSIQDLLGVPWYIVGVIHYRESDCDFTCHLFNGDPLSGRTYDDPAGLPLSPEPPYTWKQGAIAALQYDGLDKVLDWSIANSLYVLEKYNGLGYWQYNINSPYVWSGTNQYTKGKYTSDGSYDPNAVDKQIGCAAILKCMIDQDLI